MKKPYRRRILFINKRGQIKTIGFAVAFSLLSSWFTSIASILIHSKLDTSQQVSNVTLVLFGVVGLLLFSSLMACGLYITNQIYGPLYRLHKQIRDLLEGREVTPIRLRNGDDFEDLIADFNTLVSRYHEAKPKE